MKNKQGVCPYCGSENVENKNFIIDGERLYLLTVCNDCGGSFDEVFDVNFVECKKI